MMKPGMLQPFNRVWLDWLEPIEIIQDGYYPIQRKSVRKRTVVLNLVWFFLRFGLTPVETFCLVACSE